MDCVWSTVAWVLRIGQMYRLPRCVAQNACVLHFLMIAVIAVGLGVIALFVLHAPLFVVVPVFALLGAGLMVLSVVVSVWIQ